jgi:hypothetical protein
MDSLNNLRLSCIDRRLVFYFRIIVISIGDAFSTNYISSNIVIAFLIGVFLGFSDKILPTEVQKK